jgi:mevalonate kinase
MSLCIGLSGRPRSTRDVVMRIVDERCRNAAVSAKLGDLSDLAKLAIQAVQDCDVARLGRLFSAAHAALKDLDLSCPELDLLVDKAIEHGALGAKLTGAGAGGAVVALADGAEDRILAAWRDAGFEGFVHVLGRSP